MSLSNNKNTGKKWIFCLSLLATCSSVTTTLMAADAKLGYRVVQQPHVPSRSTFQSYDPTAWTSSRQNANAYGTPLPQNSYPNYHRPPPHHGNHHGGYYGGNHRHYPHHYPSYPSYPVQNGLTITYHQQLPSYTEYRSEQHGFVHGQNGRIESTKTTYISDWRRYNLPAPASGMHWIFENGRYMQVPNAR